MVFRGKPMENLWKTYGKPWKTYAFLFDHFPWLTFLVSMPSSRDRKIYVCRADDKIIENHEKFHRFPQNLDLVMMI